MGWTGRTRRLMWTGQKYRPVLSKFTQPLTGWTGQTRRLMWTGQKCRSVRVKMTSLFLAGRHIQRGAVVVGTRRKMLFWAHTERIAHWMWIWSRIFSFLPVPDLDLDPGKKAES